MVASGRTATIVDVTASRQFGCVLAGIVAWGAACASGAPEPAASAPASVEVEEAAPQDATPEPGPPSPRTEAVASEAGRRAHETAQVAMHGEPLAEEARVRFVPVARAADGKNPLQGFHRALRRLEAGEDEDGKVRIAAYGASSTAGDRYVGYLRRYLQARFGDAGPGFVATVPLWRWHRHDRVKPSASRHWVIEHAQKKKERLDGRYGLLGASAYTTNKRAQATLVARDRDDTVQRLELWFLAQPGGGTLKLSGSAGTHEVSTKADEYGPGYFEVPLEGPVPLNLKLKPKGDGEVRIFGVVAERAASGVVVDTLGIGGTRVTNHPDWDEALWRDGIQRRDPDLYLLAYGANESVDEDEEFVEYEPRLGQALQRFRQAVPRASCVLVGPQDFPMKVEPTEEEPDAQVQWVPRPRLSEVIEIQKRLAAEHGCGYFDIRAMMGGEGAMDRWVTEEPTLGRKDHLHLTPLGYGYLGRVLADALMAEYDAEPAP